ncbi:hypothetical protein HK096_007903, partial [Nowakowskiella sp. JEL0078]
VLETEGLEKIIEEDVSLMEVDQTDHQEDSAIKWFEELTEKMVVEDLALEKTIAGVQ